MLESRLIRRDLRSGLKVSLLINDCRLRLVAIQAKFFFSNFYPLFFCLILSSVKEFWLDVLKRFLASAGVAVVFGVISLVLFTLIFSFAFRPSERKIPEQAILVIDLTMNLTDRPTGFRFEDLAMDALADRTKPRHFHLREVTQAIRKAAGDDEIRGVFLTGSLQPSGYGCGYSALAELGESLNQFKKSKKPLLAYTVNPGLRDYFVLSHADRIYLNPYGMIEFGGMASQVTFFGNAFEEYGIGVQVARTGEFKGAVEPFLQDQLSESNRQQIQGFLDDRWGDYLLRISHNRKLSLEKLHEIPQESFLLNAEKAVLAGLVDKAAYFDEVVDRLNEIGVVDEETDSFVKVGLSEYLDRPRNMNEVLEIKEDERPAVSVVYLEGAILDGMGDDGVYVGGDEIASRLRTIRKDGKTKAVVLRVNSPGGSVTGAEAVRREVERVREEGIPVVVSMGSVAASGGYWVAARSDRIFARPETITGSIGVFAMIPNLKDLGNRFGLTWDTVKTAPHADVFSIVRPRTDKEMDGIQAYVDDVYDRFLNHVSAGRDLNRTAVEGIAEGRVWSGRVAREVGLVDEFGGLDDAIRYAVELAELPKDFQVIEHPRVETPFELLSEILEEPVVRKTLSGSVADQSTVGRYLSDFERRIESFVRFNDPRDAYVLLPWLWEGSR